MLNIYSVCVDVVRQVRHLADDIARFDKDQARQLRRSCLSVALNVAEGAGCRGGSRRQRYCDALGSARESWCNLEVADALGYVALPPTMKRQFDHIIGVLVKVTA